MLRFLCWAITSGESEKVRIEGVRGVTEDGNSWDEWWEDMGDEK